MTKPTLLLLHGALGSRDQFESLVPLLRDRFQLHSFDYEGHGQAPPTARPFRMEHFVENAHTYLRQQAVERTHVFGYSMGGFVACALASTHPQLVLSVATLGTKFRWNAEIAAREVALLDPQKIATKVPQFARLLAERHRGAHWETVADKTAEMMGWLAEQGGFPTEALQRLRQPVRILIGDRDPMVSVGESYEIYRSVARGELEVLPGTAHPIEKIAPERLVFSLTEFFSRNAAARVDEGDDV